jgi:hypothetical protein
MRSLRPRSWLAVTLLALMLVVSGSLVLPRQPSARGTQAVAVPQAVEVAPERVARTRGFAVCSSDKFLGASGCAAASCHGDNGPKGTPGSELTTWAGCDPHARAYPVLFGERSQQMWRTFRRAEKDALAEPQNDPLCLKCHALEVPLCRQGCAPDRPVRADAVSCESCHGPSEHWRGRHFRDDWKALSLSQKSSAGLWPTKSLTFRVMLCGTCHIGAPGQEVNHDLIAAGHPALRFEYTAFHHLLPRHWPPEDRPGNEDFEVRAWLIGQVASLRSALDLLHHRAANAATGPWPEFAEYSCFACHHGLGEKAQQWRQQARPGLQPGALPRNAWYSAAIERLLDSGTILDRHAPPGFKKELQALSEAMSKLGPDAADVAGKARGLVDRLDRWLPSLEGLSLPQMPSAPPRIPAGATRELLERLVNLPKDEKQGIDWDWEAAAQHFLALAALRSRCQGLAGVLPDPVLGRLKTMREHLVFPSGGSSPRDFSPSLFRNDLDAIREALSR